MAITSSIDVSLIMTRVSAGLLDESIVDKSMLLNLELRRHERRRNLRYRTSIALECDKDDESKGKCSRNSNNPGGQKMIKEQREAKSVDDYAKDLNQWLKKMRCTGVTGVRLESFGDIKIGVSEEPLDPTSPSLEPYPNLWQEKYTYKGYKDELGRLKGKAFVELENGDTISGSFHEGLRHGECRIETGKNGLNFLVGNYVRDQLNGKVKVSYQDGYILEGFAQDNYLHGFARIYDDCGTKKLRKFGFYCMGKIYGIWWTLIEGGGSIIQSDTETAYLYPDFKTALIGEFEETTLVRAQATSLAQVVEENNLLIPLFHEPSGAGPVYQRDVSTLEYMTSQPLLPDPYESQMVAVRKSSVPGANEGLFTKADVSAGQILAFYNGIRRAPKKTFDDPDWVRCAYKIFDPSRKKGGLDIPPEYVDSKNYCATLAHKTNHSFLPSAEFDAYDHPRFGLIPCLVAETDIKADEEIFVHYSYGLDRAPDWYLAQWAQGDYPVPDSLKDPDSK